MSGAAVIRRQNQNIDLFNRAGAIDEEHSVLPEEIGVRKRPVFRLMAARGIFIECAPGRYYIDNQASERFKAQRHRRSLLILAAAAIIFLLYIIIYYLLI
jgi:hypothetical protein